MQPASSSSCIPRISAVSYLNTVPLVWGMRRGPLRTRCRLGFCLPSECADRIADGTDDLGIVPVIEVRRQGLLAVPGTGIACRGEVRSILLISRVPPGEIATLAADIGSRTSVMLARILLRGRYGAAPRVAAMAPDLPSMLSRADAALLIGDAALRVEPAALPYHVLDLGREWLDRTGLPMVFAVWAGKPERVRPLLDAGIEAMLRESLQYGMEGMDAIVAEESAARGFAPGLVRDYLTRNVVFEIGEQEQRGMDTFLRLAAELEIPAVPEAARS